VDGATKEAFVWGLRVGFVTFGVKGGTPAVYEALEKKAGGAVRASVSNVTNSGQYIFLKALQSPEFREQQQAKVAVLRARWEAVVRAVEDTRYADCWQAYPFNAGYFMCLRLKEADAEAVRLELLDTHGIGAISLGKTDLRVAFSCLEEEDIPDCFDRIAQAIRAVQAA
jgi:aspartate/methionine/tyrosine aminotransferase